MAERTEKMRVNKNVKPYDPREFATFARNLEQIRRNISEGGKPILNIDGLQKAVRALKREDREIIERFWGLNGGINHSKKLGHIPANDVAFMEMARKAVGASKKLLELDYAVMYDSSVSTSIEKVLNKVNRKGLEVSDMECIKYLMILFIFVNNGPKMSFEEDQMSVDTQINAHFIFDERELLNQMRDNLSEYPDESINIKLLMEFLMMIDFRDMLVVKKSIGIELSQKDLHKNFTTRDLEEIEIVRTIYGIRNWKERVFPYGAWDVVTELIASESKSKLNLDDFMREVDSIRKNWFEIEKYKTGEKTLKVGSETRTLNIYKIGGLEFTDIYEVMFIYLERNLITH